jgi:ferredoxin
MRIAIDRERCIGSGNCSFYAPATFDLDDDLKVIVIDANGDSVEDITAAADGCPVKAITVQPDEPLPDVVG